MVSEGECGCAGAAEEGRKAVGEGAGMVWWVLGDVNVKMFDLNPNLRYLTMLGVRVDRCVLNGLLAARCGLERFTTTRYQLRFHFTNTGLTHINAAGCGKLRGVSARD